MKKYSFLIDVKYFKCWEVNTSKREMSSKTVAIIINNKLYLAFNYSNEIYIHNLGKKIKLSELEQYIKEN